MKKFLISLIVFCVVILGAVVVVPIVYDVDKKLRPEIESAAAKALDGSLKIGKMKLNLWGGIKVDIDGLELKSNSSEKNIVSAETAKLNIPFKALLGGQVQVLLSLTKPEINVSKSKAGSYNFESLFKSGPGNSKAEVGKAEKAKNDKASNLSALNNIDLDIDISAATLNYHDYGSGFKTAVSDFNFKLENVGFGKDIELKVNSFLDIQPTKDITAKGNLVVNGTTRINWGKTNYESVTTDLKVDLTQMKAKVADLINKESGVPLKMDLKTSLYPGSMQLEQLDFLVNDLRLSTTGEINSFNPLSYKMEVNSSLMDLKAWRKIVTPIGQFAADGILTLRLKLNGKGDKHLYSGSVNLTEGGASLPGFKNPISGMRANLVLKNESLQIKDISMLVGSSSLSMNGKLVNFSSPSVALGIYSPNLSASDFIAEMTNEEKRLKIEAAKKDQPELTEAQIQKMVMGPIEQLKQIPILKKLKVKANIKVDKLYYEKMAASNFHSDLNYSNLIMKMTKTRVDIFEGRAALVSLVDIRGAKPKYSLRAKVANLNTVSFTESFMAKLKGTVTGLMNADFSIQGLGTSKADLKTNLKGQGGFKLVNGTWSGLKAMAIIGKKLSKIKGAEKEAAKVRMGNKFKTFSGDFKIENAKFTLKSFNMDLEEAKMAFIGRGTVDFDMNANLVASLLVPFNQPPKKIRYRDGRAELPVEITGKITSPKIGVEKMLRRVVGAYAENEVKKKAKKAVKKEVQKLLKSKKAKDLLKRLGI